VVSSRDNWLFVIDMYNVQRAGRGTGGSALTGGGRVCEGERRERKTKNASPLSLHYGTIQLFIRCNYCNMLLRIYIKGEQS